MTPLYAGVAIAKKSTTELLFYEAKADVTERRHQYRHNYIGDLNTPLSEIERQSAKI